jgi:hypothetical protein
MLNDTRKAQVDEVRKLMETRLRVRGKTLDQQVRKAGRLLPRAERREATYLAQAATVLDHPKLSRMVDPMKVAAAHGRLTTFLKKIDPKDRAKGRVLNWLGSAVLVLIIGFIITVWVLVEHGIV